MDPLSSSEYVHVPLGDENDMTGNIDTTEVPTSATTENQPTPWRFEYYQQFFDVDTSQVLRRLFSAIVPHPHRSFVHHVLKPHADLYGPFWIATTLTLVAAIGGNMSNYLATQGRATTWHYDFKAVMLSATIIYVYWWIVPLLLHFMLRSKCNLRKADALDGDADKLLQNDSEPTGLPTHRGSLASAHQFTDLLSIYGYSLTIFVPVAVLWTIQNHILQWVLVILGTTISGTMLTLAMLPVLRKQQPKLSILLIFLVVAIHCVFSVSLMLTFFYNASSTAAGVPVSSTNQPLVSAVTSGANNSTPHKV